MKGKRTGGETYCIVMRLLQRCSHSSFFFLNNSFVRFNPQRKCGVFFFWRCLNATGNDWSNQRSTWRRGGRMKLMLSFRLIFFFTRGVICSSPFFVFFFARRSIWYKDCSNCALSCCLTCYEHWFLSPRHFGKAAAQALQLRDTYRYYCMRRWWMFQE